jgi:hypothetical protein
MGAAQVQNGFDRLETACFRFPAKGEQFRGKMLHPVWLPEEEKQGTRSLRARTV